MRISFSNLFTNTFGFPADVVGATNNLLSNHIHIQKVEPICYSLHVLRPWNCPISRNEQRRKPHDDVYNQRTRTLSTTYSYWKCSRHDVYAPHRASPLLCFWPIVWIFQVLTRQNQSVQLRLLCICIPPLLSHFRTSGKSSLCKSKHLIVNEKQKNGKTLEKTSKHPLEYCIVCWNKMFRDGINN